MPPFAKLGIQQLLQPSLAVPRGSLPHAVQPPSLESAHNHPTLVTCMHAVKCMGSPNSTMALWAGWGTCGAAPG